MLFTESTYVNGVLVSLSGRRTKESLTQKYGKMFSIRVSYIYRCNVICWFPYMLLPNSSFLFPPHHHTFHKDFTCDSIGFCNDGWTGSEFPFEKDSDLEGTGGSNTLLPCLDWASGELWLFFLYLSSTWEEKKAIYGLNWHNEKMILRNWNKIPPEKLQVSCFWSTQQIALTTNNTGNLESQVYYVAPSPIWQYAHLYYCPLLFVIGMDYTLNTIK